MSYEIFLEPEIHAARHTLPGNIRQRFYRVINALADNPYPQKAVRLIYLVSLSPKV